MRYLDLTKGILVLLMVLYHSLNYTNKYELAFRYLSFLPLSFILITGFLLSTVYSPRYRTGERKLIGRLLLRGMRLFILFVLLNVGAQFVRSPAYGRSVGVLSFFERWYQVFVTGGSLVAAFDVLLPIAYLLLLSPCLIALAQRQKWFVPAATGLLIMGCSALEWLGSGIPNLNLLSVGILGMLVGKTLPNLSCLGRFFWVTLLAYGAYAPVGLAWGGVFLVQLLGAVAALALICAASVRLGDNTWWSRRVVRLGQYSLVAYIAQIGILQMLSRFMGRPDPISIKSLMLFAVTLFIMTLIVEFTEWVRSNFSPIDRAYRSVFA